VAIRRRWLKTPLGPKDWMIRLRQAGFAGRRSRKEFSVPCPGTKLARVVPAALDCTVTGVLALEAGRMNSSAVSLSVCP
jgi:hypothetical protein